MMKSVIWLKNYQFSPVINLPKEYYVHDFSKGEDSNPTSSLYSVGRYNEKRINMYTSDLFTGESRDVHMGIDIAAPVGEEVFSFYDGEVFLFGNNQGDGDYGPTIIVKYNFDEGVLYALYGHLSLSSLEGKVVGQKIKKGDVVGEVGARAVNGGWFPHLHFQLSVEKPIEANMPGVVSEKSRSSALLKYPDPQLVLGSLYE